MLHTSLRHAVAAVATAALSLLSGLHLTAADTAAPYEWEAGAVFQQYNYVTADNPDAADGPWPNQFEELDPGHSPEAQAKARQPRPLQLDIAGATQAEIAIEWTPVHIATPGWFTVNWKESRNWVPLPTPVGTPGDPLQYHFCVHGSLPQPLPLDWLKQGDNVFRFAAGLQTHHLFNTGNPALWGYGCLWIYDFSVRIFHPRSPEHPRVAILNLASGDTIGENPIIAFRAEPGKAPIERVDVFACYDGYNVSGSGFSREWHGQMRYGQPSLHVGSATTTEGNIVWDTTWIPDQEQPVRLVAIVTDAAGWHSVSAIVDDLHFIRHGRHVRMISATDVPPRFSVVYNQEKSCHFEIGDLPARPNRALLQIVDSFGGPKLESVKFNGTEIARGFGRLHRYSFDAVDVPTSLVHSGQNTYSIFSTETVHGPEMDWPGPALLLEFKD